MKNPLPHPPISRWTVELKAASVFCSVPQASLFVFSPCHQPTAFYFPASIFFPIADMTAVPANTTTSYLSCFLRRSPIPWLLTSEAICGVYTRTAFLHLSEEAVFVCGYTRVQLQKELALCGFSSHCAALAGLDGTCFGLEFSD